MKELSAVGAAVILAGSLLVMFCLTQAVIGADTSVTPPVARLGIVMITAGASAVSAALYK